MKLFNNGNTGNSGSSGCYDCTVHGSHNVNLNLYIPATGWANWCSLCDTGSEPVIDHESM